MKVPIRVIIGIMIFMTTFTNYMMRSNMSVSAVAMAIPTKESIVPLCFRGKNITIQREPQIELQVPLFNNTNTVIAAYFYGFLVTSLPAGLVADFFGAYWTILITSLLIGLLNTVTVFAAKVDVTMDKTNKTWILIFIVRFLMGMLGGFAYPAANSLIAKWAPPQEKGKFLSAMLGNTLGTVITWPVVGVTSEKLGWSWGFHVLTIIQLVFCVVFALTVSNSPLTHKWISEDEKNYIVESQQGHVSNKKKGVPPYLAILKNVPFWAMTIAQFGNLWCLNLILTYTPKYLKKVQGFDLKEAAGLAALPYLLRLFCSMIFGSIGDYMRKKQVMSVTNIRKVFLSISHLIPAVLFLIVYPIRCMKFPIVAMLTLNQAFNGAVVVGHLQNPQDLSPNYASTLYGLFSFFGGTTGVIVPEIGKAIEKAYGPDLMGPTIIYLLGSIVLIATAVVYFIFGKADVQPFNELGFREDAKEGGTE